MPTKIFFCTIACVYVLFTCYFDRRQNAVYGGDSFGYYAHLPSFFIYNDIGNYEKTVKTYLIQTEKNVNTTPADLGFSKAESGRFYIKYPLGVPLLMTPFFLSAHLFCKVSGMYEPNGWSAPYVWSSMAAAIFYVTLALWLLFMALKRSFPNKNLRFLVVLGLGFATNLFYQVTYNPVMAHQYEFFLFALLVWLLEYKNDTKLIWFYLKIGIVCGLITLVRHSNALCVLLPLFWNEAANFTIIRWIRDKFKILKIGLFFLLLFYCRLLYSVRIGLKLRDIYG
jgi:hypothetical protein